MSLHYCRCETAFILSFIRSDKPDFAKPAVCVQLNDDSPCAFQFLPVYKPSEEEKNDPNLYADNVQKLMAK